MSGVSIAEQLYRLLPLVYRERDNPRRTAEGREAGDLEKLLAAQGELLQSVYNTILQLREDRFPLPDQEGGEGCQSWVLPYIAQLLDVRLVSPDLEGRRAEVSRAIRWRQGKGTLSVLEEIARLLLGLEVEVVEGWRKVALTARVDTPLLPAVWYGDRSDYQASSSPSYRASHPGLAAVTLDFRRPMRVVKGEDEQRGRSWHPHGVPCFPVSYQDRALRTVDIRDPGSRQGHAHPRRILFYLPQWKGFFVPRPQTINWSMIAEKTNFADDKIRIQSDQVEKDGRILPRVRYLGLTPQPLRIRGVVEIHREAVYEFENIWFDNRVEIGAALVSLEGCAARRLLVETPRVDLPVLNARHCVLNVVESPRGKMRLEYCTVLKELVAEVLECSDSILLIRPRKDRGDTDIPRSGCIRYSCLPAIPASERISDGVSSRLRILERSNIHLAPLFVSRRFGEPGCGVLLRETDGRIRFGAEDGGEMGACHGLRYGLREQATMKKLEEFMPLAMSAVLITDSLLPCRPPEMS